MITSKQARVARESLGMSQTVVARETGISRSYLSQFENGSLQLAKPLIDKLQEFFSSKGYDFGTSSSESIGNNLKESAEKTESKLNQKIGKGQDTVSVKTEDLSELIGLLGDFVVHANQPAPKEDEADNFNVVVLPEFVGDKNVQELITAFDKSEQAIISHLKDDAKGEVRNGGILSVNRPSERARKLVSAMAIQYIRSVAIKTGEMIVPINSLVEAGVFSEFEGDDSEKIMEILESNLDYQYPVLDDQFAQNVVVAE